MPCRGNPCRPIPPTCVQDLCVPPGPLHLPHPPLPCAAGLFSRTEVLLLPQQQRRSNREEAAPNPLDGSVVPLQERSALLSLLLLLQVRSCATASLSRPLVCHCWSCLSSLLLLLLLLLLPLLLLLLRLRLLLLCLLPLLLLLLLLLLLCKGRGAPPPPLGAQVVH